MYMVSVSDELPQKEVVSLKPETYNKFVVYAFSEEHPVSIVPWTGLDQTLSYAKEKLAEGYTIQIRPYSQSEWAKKMSQKVEM